MCAALNIPNRLCFLTDPIFAPEGFDSLGMNAGLWMF